MNLDKNWLIDDFSLQLHAYAAISFVGAVLFFSTTDIWFKLFALMYDGSINQGARFKVQTQFGKCALFCVAYPFFCVLIFLLPLGLGVFYFSEVSSDPAAKIHAAYDHLLPYNLVGESLDRLAGHFATVPYGWIWIAASSACVVIIVAFAAMTTIDAQVMAYCQAHHTWRGHEESSKSKTIHDVRKWMQLLGAGAILFIIVVLLASYLYPGDGEKLILIQQIFWVVGFAVIVTAALVTFNVLYLLLTSGSEMISIKECAYFNLAVVLLYILVFAIGVESSENILPMKIFYSEGFNTFQIVAPAVVAGSTVLFVSLALRRGRSM